MSSVSFFRFDPLHFWKIQCYVLLSDIKFLIMKALKETILLGIFFLILVTTYSSFSFIVTYMYEHKQGGFKQMGPVLLAANYFTFLIANSFAPSIQMSFKSQMLVAAFCYTVNYVTEIFQLEGAMGIVFSVIGAIFGGYGAALLWVCYGAYMKELCKMNNEEHLQGRYFGILNGIAFSSILFGSLVTTFCFELFSDRTYFIILASLGAFSFLFCYMFVRQIERKGPEVTHHWCNELKASLTYYSQMTAIIPTLIFDGLVLGFISTSSTKLMPQQSSRVQIGYFLIVVGVGCILGGFMTGYLSDLLQMKNAGKLSIMIVLITSVLTVLQTGIKNKASAFIIGFLWGISRQFMEGWLYVACSRNYNGRLESYANMKQLHSLSFCIYQAIVIATKLKLQTSYFMLIFIIMSPLCFVYLNKLPAPINQEQSSIIPQKPGSKSSSQQDN